jgi:hypothetical protein
MRRSVPFAGVLVALGVLTGLLTPAAAGARMAQSLVVVSDTSGTWVNHFGTTSGSAKLTHGNRGCYHVNAGGYCTGGAWPKISGAHWVWTNRNVSPAHALEGVRKLDFTWTFSLPDDATNIGGTLQITADNAYRVFLNGVAFGHDGQLNRRGDDGSWASIETYTIQPVPGANTVTVRAVNYRSSSSNPFDNPAGIIFRADISYEE